MYPQWLNDFFKKPAEWHKERRRVAKNRKFLKKLISPQKIWQFQRDMWYENDVYMIERLVRRDDIRALLENHDEAKEAVFQRLKTLPHTFRRDSRGWLSTFPYDEGPEEAHKLTPKALLTVYLILKALEGKDFCNNIGAFVEAALKDPYSEHGGVVVLNENGEPQFCHFESALAKEKNPRNKGRYKFPEEALATLHIAGYHIHASSEDSTEFAGPSQGIALADPADLSSCDVEIVFNAQSHNFVITKLNGRSFNIDYYGGVKMPDDKRPIVVLDLGNYKYD